MFQSLLAAMQIGLPFQASLPRVCWAARRVQGQAVSVSPA